MGQKEAIEDIMDLFDIGKKDENETAAESESNDYSATAEADQGAKPSFDELIDGLGDSLEKAAEGSPVLPLPEPKPKKAEKPAEKPKVEAVVAQPAVASIQEKVRAAIEKEEDIKAAAEINKIANAPLPQSNEESIKAAILVTNEEDEVNIDADAIFAISPSSKKEQKVEESNVKEVSVKETVVETTVQKEPKVKETIAELPPEKTGKTVGSSPQEPIPFDSPNETASKGTLPEKDVTVKVRKTMKVLKDGQFNWLLTPPTDKYASFYADKEDALDYLLPDGQIQFDILRKEVIASRVNLDEHNNDPQKLTDRMADIQRYKERLFEIQSIVDKQFFRWRAWMEGIQGQLLRIESEKNAEARKGVIWQHMRDFTGYFGDLENLHDGIKQVMKNLDSAWETLNRKVTVTMKEYEESGREKVVYERQEKFGVPRRAEPTKQQLKEIVSNDESDELDDNSAWDSISLGDDGGVEGNATPVAQKQDSSKPNKSDDLMDMLG